MKKSNPLVRVMFVFLVLALTSCGGSAPDGSAIQTIVAGTFQALTAPAPATAAASTVPPVVLSSPAAQPTAELSVQPTSNPSAAAQPTSAQPTAMEPNVVFEGISFYLDYQLTNSWRYEITTPPDPSSDNPFQEPSLYQLDFQGFVVPSAENGPAWRNPRLYIIPVANMESFPGEFYGQDLLSQLQQILADKPDAINDDMPVLPYSINFDNSEAFHSNVKYLNFQNGSGVRFLAEYAQTVFPVGKITSYIFQGLTTDGKYYVSLTLPISQTALDQYNAPYANIGNDQSVWENLSNNYDSYLNGAIAILESTPDSSFTPDLSRLDALIQSLSVNP